MRRTSSSCRTALSAWVARTSRSTSSSRTARFAGRQDEQLLQPPLPPSCAGAVGILRVELGERVQCVRVARVGAMQLLEQVTRVRPAFVSEYSLASIKRDVGVRRVELARPQQLRLRVGESAPLEIGQAEVRVAERIVGRELDELLELHLRFRQLPALQEVGRQGAGGEHLFHVHWLFLPAGRHADGKREDEHRMDARATDSSDHEVTWFGR